MKTNIYIRQEHAASYASRFNMKRQFIWMIAICIFLITANKSSFAQIIQVNCNCNLSYPDSSSLPRSSAAFNESEILRASDPGTTACGSTGDRIKVWYNDEHALTLGVRRVIIKHPGGKIDTTNYTITTPPASPTCVSNPLVGDTISSGGKSGNDVAVGGGRPLWPALFITDLTVKGASSRAGDWQQGGTGLPPTIVCGTWKAAVKTVDSTKTPPAITVTPDADPSKNDWNGITDVPPGGFNSLTDQGYGAECGWDVNMLGLISGHTYRLQFMVHDGDQNKTGGDVGESCTSLNMPLCQSLIRRSFNDLNCAIKSEYLSATYKTNIINPTFSWTLNGVSIGTGINNGTVGVDSILISSPGTYRFTLHDPAYGANDCFDEVTVNQNTTPPSAAITINGPSSFCQGGSVMLSASSSTNYLWNTGATTSSINVTTSGTYSVTVTGANFCSATSSVGTTITVNPNPVINISANGPTTFCQNSSITLSTNGALGYIWSNGATTSAINVSTSGTYTVTGTSAAGCSSTATPVTVTVNPNVQVSISPLSLCEGQSGVVCATGTGSSLKYKWNNGIATSCLTVSVPGNYSVLITDGNGCSGTSSVNVNFSNTPALKVTASGPTTFCNGGSVSLTASGAYSYIWNTGSTSALINVNSQGLYTVTGSNIYGCQINALVYITVYASPVVSITPESSTTFCQGGSVALNAAGAGTYLWSNGKNGISINANSSGIYSVVGTDGNGCTASASTAINVNPLPVVSLDNLGTACLNAGVFDLNQGSPLGGIYSGQGVSFNGFNPLATAGVGSYLIAYTYTDINGCTNSASSPIAVVNVPDNPGVISGLATAVCANTSKSYSISAVNGATSYTWIAPNNAIVINGQGTNSISISFGNSFTSGTLSVMANNGCGSTSSSSITIGSVPLAPTAIYGNVNPCTRGYNIYWTNAVDGAASYNWTVPSGTSIIAGQGTDTISVNTGRISGNITVKALNACGASTAITSLPVNVSCRTIDSTLASAIPNDIVMVAYPNPAHNELNVLFISNNENNYTLRIFDITGRLVKNEIIKAEVGDNLIKLNLNVAKGLYVVMLSSGDLNKQSKIIIQ